MDIFPTNQSLTCLSLNRDSFKNSSAFLCFFSITVKTNSLIVFTLLFGAHILNEDVLLLSALLIFLFLKKKHSPGEDTGSDVVVLLDPHITELLDDPLDQRSLIVPEQEGETLEEISPVIAIDDETVQWVVQPVFVVDIVVSNPLLDLDQDPKSKRSAILNKNSI